MVCQRVCLKLHILKVVEDAAGRGNLPLHLLSRFPLVNFTFAILGELVMIPKQMLLVGSSLYR